MFRVLFFAMFFMVTAHHALSQEMVLDRVVALVNNRPVLISEVNQYLSRILPQSTPLEPQADIPPSKERIIQQLIEEELIQQEAERQGIQVTQEDFEKAFEELKKRNKMNTAQFILELAREGVPFQKFCTELKRELRKSLVIRREVINRIVITDEIVQKAYEERKAIDANSRKIHLKQIFQPFRPDIAEEEKKALRLRMDGILTLIAKEGSFEQVAEKFVSTSATLSYSDLGWMHLKDIARPLAQAIKELNSGEISGLIESPLGLHIVKVEDLKDETGPAAAEARENLRRELFEKEFRKRYRDWIDNLRETAHIEIRR